MDEPETKIHQLVVLHMATPLLHGLATPNGYRCMDAQMWGVHPLELLGSVTKQTAVRGKHHYP